MAKLLIVFLEMVKEDDGVKHDEQAKFIDSESVFARKIPDYQYYRSNEPKFQPFLF